MRNLVTILAAAALILVPVGAADAETITVGVGQTYTTIQAAVNAASAGDTINVLAGTYVENVIVGTGKGNLKIIGSGSDVTHLSIGTGTGFSVYSPITVMGFDIYGNGRTAGNALTFHNAAPSGTLANPGLFQDNKVTDLKWGLKSGDWNIVYWDFKDNVYDNVYIPIGLENMSHVQVTGNTFTGYKEGVYGDGSYVDIKNNSFLGSDKTGGTVWGAITLYSVAHDWNIYGNHITDSIRGVYVRNNLAGSLTNVSVSYNNIVGNTWGIDNEDDVTLLAEYNWWGDAAGPSSGYIIGLVDYDPWLTQPVPEPSSVAAIIGLLGAGGALWLRRRRRAAGAPWSEENRQAIRQIIDHGRTSA